MLGSVPLSEGAPSCHPRTSSLLLLPSRSHPSALAFLRRPASTAGERSSHVCPIARLLAAGAYLAALKKQHPEIGELYGIDLSANLVAVAQR